MKMNKKGFTLIEMLVVIAIIAILVAIVIPTVNNATKKAKEAADVANIRAAVAEYMIATLDSDDDWSFDASKLNYEDKYDFDDATSVVSYDAEVLDGTFEWKVGALYTETDD